MPEIVLEDPEEGPEGDLDIEAAPQSSVRDEYFRAASQDEQRRILAMDAAVTALLHGVVKQDRLWSLLMVLEDFLRGDGRPA